MACTIRVQLVDVKTGDDAYETLHDEMKARGYPRTISSGGTTYRLPFGSYNSPGSADRNDVLANAKAAAAAATGHKSRILVTESAGRTWSNLEKD